MTQKFKSSFTFGGPMAESDPLLSAAYWDNGDFEAIASPSDPRCFVIGRTGSGKSAAFQHLEEISPTKVIRIIPENLSMPYITNLDVIQKLVALGVHLEPFLKALWKHVILVEILKHRYGISSPERKQSVLASLRDRISRNPAKARALEYLDEFGDKFWCETDERVKQIAEKFVQKIGSADSVGLDVKQLALKLSDSAEDYSSREYKQEVASKYQKVVNEAQLPRLNEMIVILNDEILDSPQHFRYLIIDDLDKEWVDDSLANLLIRCLFQAVIDMQKVRYLKVLVALRTNIFRQLDYGGQARGGQEEKVRGMALHIRWTENDLRALMEHRMLAAFKFHGLALSPSLKGILPNNNRRTGEPVQYIFSRTMMRPRDVIQYMNRCVREAVGKNKISWESMFAAEKDYSEDRLLALRDEWKDPYLDIDKLFGLFRNKPCRFGRDQFENIAEEIALLIADDRFRGANWLTPLCQRLWEAGAGEDTWYDIYGPLVVLLFEISFIGLATGRDNKARYSYDNWVSIPRAVDLPETIYFEIHPAFWRALDTKDIDLR
jgi:hypothetical protein